nr:hypothetical protein [Tanacetum cinerariifolium]
MKRRIERGTSRTDKPSRAGLVRPWLLSKEQIEKEENRALDNINKTQAQKAAKRRKLNEEVKDVEEIKQHLEIMPDEDDVYTDASLLARKVPVVEIRYLLSRFTLDQMVNAVRLQVEVQSEMSLELIRFTRQQLQEGQHD